MEKTAFSSGEENLIQVLQHERYKGTCPSQNHQFQAQNPSLQHDHTPEQVSDKHAVYLFIYMR